MRTLLHKNMKLFLAAVIFLLATISPIQGKFAGKIKVGNVEYEIPQERRPEGYRIGGRDMRGPNGEISGYYTLVNVNTRWPKSLVPWELAENNNFTDLEKEIIQKGLQELQNTTCIQFVKRTNETAYLSFKNNGPGCWATWGYKGIKQEANLARGCFGSPKTTMHEVMHALGFHHEQTRYDRDLYIDVQWDNIQAGTAFNFEKLPRPFAYPSYPYDFTSVMQYFLTAFGTQGRPTMVLMTKNDTLDEPYIGYAKKLSKTDINRIRSAYRCDYQGEGAGRPDATRFKKKNKISHVAALNYF